ncbi:MAG: hypothetical protein HF975_04200 [ANME-2 cluster archaeon]|nr:hypothetical protein [ANME-2 cluster archaeon]
MVDLGYSKITNDVIIGQSPRRVDLNIETATDMYPGRLAAKGTTDFDLVVCNALLPPGGWLGYGLANSAAKPTNRATAYAADKVAPLHKGAGFPVRTQLAAGAKVDRYNLVANWASGQVIGPVSQGDGGIWLTVPFVKKTSEFDTTIELPANMIVKDTLVEVITNVASGTIDVGLLSSEAGGDADGFVDGQDCATAGIYRPGATLTTGSNEVYYSAAVRGALLRALTAGSDVATDVGTYEENIHLCDGTAKSLSYTTSDHTITGNIHLLLVHPNFQVIAQADETIDASAAAAALWAMSRI